MTTVTVSVSRESEAWSESETERHAQPQAVTVTETQSQLVACFYTVIYQSVFPTRTTSTPAATSSPSGRLAAYGSSWYGRI